MNKASTSAVVVGYAIKGVAFCLRPLARPAGWLVGKLITKVSGLDK
jgi:hypothetical protein